MIAIDDHSHDHSFDILGSYAQDFPTFLIARRKENSGGASAPRNNGIQLASGKWVLFLDSDDYLTEHAVSDAMAVAEASDNDMICMPYARGIGSTRAISKSAFSSPTTVTNLSVVQTKLYNSLNAVGKLFKRELIDRYQAACFRKATTFK
ncbi:glycosyltransferase family 2 protein [Enterococcus saccharolyticus]|uniref:glycosyltransferase family 2 protein n=1 Tax=Enterococcus saccharolyticus TaxID=41997 RepID=UPI0039E1E30C